MAKKKRSPPKKHGKRISGQATTETLVILAAVMIVAMVGISILGDGLTTLGDTKESQSKIFWSRQAPVSVVEGSAGDGNLSIVVENKGSYPVRVTGLLSGEENLPADSAWMQPGEKAVLSAKYRFFRSATCGAFGSQPGTLSIPNFGFSYLVQVGAGGESAEIDKIEQADTPYSLRCYAPDSSEGSTGGSCGSLTCGEGESCCTVSGNSLKYYCYDSEKVACSDPAPCDSLGWTHWELGCPEPCGGCNPELGACCPTEDIRCMAAGSPCTSRPFLICYGGLGEWTSKCCVDTRSMVSANVPCNVIACNGGTCDGNNQACCYDSKTGSAYCMDNGQACAPFGIACGGAFCQPDVLECCLSTHTCVPIGTCE